MSASEGELEVDTIIGERKSRRGLEYLVHWKNFDASEDSWEPLKNLKHAAAAIANFRQKVSPKKKSTKKSRSRSRSKSRGRSGSKSPSRSKRTSTRSRSSSQGRSKSETTVTTISTPTSVKREVETVTNSPARQQRSTETITRSYQSPTESQRVSTVSRVTEVRTTTTSVDGPVRSTSKASGGPLQQYVCAPLCAFRDRCSCVVRSDYPAIVVFATIAIVALSFVLQNNVDFDKVWAAVVGFFTGIWAWLTTLVSKKE